MADDLGYAGLGPVWKGKYLCLLCRLRLRDTILPY
jgi:hypothetical protein